MSAGLSDDDGLVPVVISVCVLIVLLVARSGRGREGFADPWVVLLMGGLALALLAPFWGILRVSFRSQLVAHVAPDFRDRVGFVEAMSCAPCAALNAVFPRRQIDAAILARELVSKAVVPRECNFDEERIRVRPIVPVTRWQPLWRESVDSCERSAGLVRDDWRHERMSNCLGQRMKARQGNRRESYGARQLASVNPSRVRQIDDDADVCLPNLTVEHGAKCADSLLAHEARLGAHRAPLQDRDDCQHGRECGNGDVREDLVPPIRRRLLLFGITGALFLTSLLFGDPSRLGSRRIVQLFAGLFLFSQGLLFLSGFRWTWGWWL
jgi:hypothetical protein